MMTSFCVWSICIFDFVLVPASRRLKWIIHRETRDNERSKQTKKKERKKAPVSILSIIHPFVSIYKGNKGNNNPTMSLLYEVLHRSKIGQTKSCQQRGIFEYKYPPIFP